MALMGYVGARGKLIHEKSLKSKISCQTPFQLYKYSRSKKTLKRPIYSKWGHYATYLLEIQYSTFLHAIHSYCSYTFASL
jgi:hypothetical protein